MVGMVGAEFARRFGSQGWNKDICGCECGPCCFALFCPSCAYGTMVARLPIGTPDVCCAGSCCGACALHWSLTGAPPLPQKSECRLQAGACVRSLGPNGRMCSAQAWLA